MLIKKLGIDIVDGCQLRCIGCPNSTLKKKVQFMEEDILCKCLSNIDVKVDILRLYNFGEPLLHPKFVNITHIINDWGKAKTVEVSTNGQFGQVESELFRAEIDTLIVSCDGEGTEEDYERIRNGAKWDKLMSFLPRALSVTPKAKHIVRGIIQTKEGKARWKSVLRNEWKLECREWHPFPRSVENPSGKIASKSKGTCRYIRKDNLYVNYKGDVGPCCVYPDAINIGSLLSQKASKLVKRKRGIKKEMDRKREGVCLECAF